MEHPAKMLNQKWFRGFESLPLRQKGNCKCELSASLRSAANLYGIFGEKEKDLSIKGKRNFFIRIFENRNSKGFLFSFDL